jgi:hypothetical protein
LTNRSLPISIIFTTERINGAGAGENIGKTQANPTQIATADEIKEAVMSHIADIA